MAQKPPEGVDGFLVVVLGCGGQVEIVESGGWGKEAMGGGTFLHRPLDIINVFPWNRFWFRIVRPAMLLGLIYKGGGVCNERRGWLGGGSRRTEPDDPRAPAT
jgi:hypothetical protein